MTALKIICISNKSRSRMHKYFCRPNENKYSKPSAKVNIFQEDAWSSDVTSNRVMMDRKNLAAREVLPLWRRLQPEGPNGESFQVHKSTLKKEWSSMSYLESTVVVYACTTQITLFLFLLSLYTLVWFPKDVEKRAANQNGEITEKSPAFFLLLLTLAALSWE